MHVWNVLYAARWKYRTHKIAILAPSHKFVGLYLLSWGMYRQLEKNLLNTDTSSTWPHNKVNFGLLTAEICWRVWGTPSNFNGFRILAALLHGTLVVGVSQTLRHWTEGATYIWQGAITLGIGPHSSFIQNTPGSNSSCSVPDDWASTWAQLPCFFKKFMINVDKWYVFYGLDAHPTGSVKALMQTHCTDPSQEKSPADLVLSSSTTGLPSSTRTMMFDQCEHCDTVIDCVTAHTLQLFPSTSENEPSRCGLLQQP